MQRRVAAGWILAVVAAAGVAACSGSSATDGWNTTKDSTGSCQVQAPPDWQLGRDFFLEREDGVAGPFPSDSGLYPPGGDRLWGADASNPAKASALPAGHWFQLRASKVSGQTVCSVWRVKESTDFTAQESDQMRQVGNSLQVVQ